MNGPLVADLDGTRAAVGDQGGDSCGASLAISHFTPPPEPGEIFASSTKQSFGNVAVCQAGKQSILVHNVGKGKLAISGISTTGPYAVSPSAAVSLVPSGAITLTIVFAPTAAGPAPGTLRITSDDPAVPTLTVTRHLDCSERTG